MEKDTKMKFNILAILCIIIIGFAITPITLQNDTYYTIKIGEHIMQDGIDMQDPFSWHSDLPYTYPHWLYDVSTYLIYNLGGYQGIYIATIILTCILGLVIYLTNVKLLKNNLTSFIITLGVMYLIQDFIAARAQLATFIFFVLTVYCIEMFLDTSKRRYIIYLIIIPIIIANLHVAVWPFYFVLYLPYIAEYLLCVIMDINIIDKFSIYMKNKRLKYLEKKENKQEKIEKIQQEIEKINNRMVRIEDKQKQRRENPYKIVMNKTKVTKWLIVVLVVTLLTGFLTPLGEVPYTYLVKTMQGNTTENISEHLPLTLINNKEFMCVIIVFLALLMFTDTKIRLRDLFMIGGLLLLAFMTRRQTSMYIIIGAYVLNRLVCAFIDKYDPEGSNKVIKFINTIYGKIIVLGLIVIVALMLYKPKIGDEFVNKRSYPVEAVEYMKNNLDIENMRLYNEYNYGSYLLLNDIPVFIDSRADLYAPEFNGGKDIFSDFLNTSNIGLHYETKMEEYKITHVILYKNAKLNLFLPKDKNYKEIYSDDNFILYERTPVQD